MTRNEFKKLLTSVSKADTVIVDMTEAEVVTICDSYRLIKIPDVIYKEFWQCQKPCYPSYTVGGCYEYRNGRMQERAPLKLQFDTPISASVSDVILECANFGNCRVIAFDGGGGTIVRESYIQNIREALNYFGYTVQAKDHINGIKFYVNDNFEIVVLPVRPADHVMNVIDKLFS